MLIAILILAALLVYLMLPRLPARDFAPLLGRDYAHRGLWGGTVPENSLAGFRRAAEAGYGIELDVRLTGDGHLVVHHDNSTLRLCGREMRIKETPLAALRELRLNGTAEGIPTFEEVLAAVDGRVPLIVELKTEGDADALARAVYDRMQTCAGPWCMESFDPMAVRWFRRNAPEVIRGQLSFAPFRRQKKASLFLRDLVLGTLLVNAAGRPDFIAYDHRGDTALNLPLALNRALGALMVAWTVRSQQDMTRLRTRFDLLIFEGFIPADKPASRR